MVLRVDPTVIEGFIVANTEAAATISAAGTVDGIAMLNAAAMAVGLIGETYLAAYGPAQTSNIASTLLVGGLHAAIGAATQASMESFVALDER